ncbi:hypothetical protein M3J09_004441 [Ascochyta lentis]
MSSVIGIQFRPPPIVECISQGSCLGIGRKVFSPHHICNDCLTRHDPHQLRTRANISCTALCLIDEEIHRRQTVKQNIEAHGRYLCAFEDPDFQHCRWRRRDLNLRGSRLTCKVVRQKGAACTRCWRRRLQKISIIQYFTPSGLCHEEADKVVSSRLVGLEDEEDDDVEGYNEILA